MAIQTLNVGSGPGAGDGEGLRSSQVKVNSNFAVPENAASKIVQASSADTTGDKVMLSDYAWRGAQLGDYFTYGGTADAITLTSANLKAGGTLIAGMKFRFKATTTNTGATTIAVDGGAATACVTPTGVALPAGFIRTDVITECEYDGSSFVVSRKIESGSNTDGEYVRYEDGTQECWQTYEFVSSQLRVTFSASPETNSNWNLPKAFIDSNYVLSISGTYDITTGADRNTENYILHQSYAFSPSACYAVIEFNVAASSTKRLMAIAKGRWY